MKRKNKSYMKYSVMIVCLILCTILFSFTLAGCGASPLYDYSDLVATDYIPTSAEMFIDDHGFSSIKLNETRDIKILQLTDIHLGNGFLCVKKDRKALEAVCTIIEYSKPDLIILTGDIVYPSAFMTGSNDNLTALKIIAEIIEKYKTPWTMCFGNHDAEWMAKYSKAELCNYLESDQLNYCLFERGPSELEGMGNHAINVYNSNDSLNSCLILFDNGEYVGETQLSGYEAISQKQTDWYENIITTLNTTTSTIVQSFVFYHVPGMEYKNAWEYYRSGATENIEYFFGWANEGDEKISCSAELGPLYDKMMELNSTKGIFCGHDHFNDFSIEYNGIRYTFSKSIDYTAYILQGIAYKTEQRGGTLLTLHNDTIPTGERFTISTIKLTDIA